MANVDPPENPHFAPSRCVAIKLTRKLAKNPSKSTFQPTTISHHTYLPPYYYTLPDIRLLMLLGKGSKKENSILGVCIQCCKSGLVKIFLPMSDDKTWILVESASWSRVQTAIGSSAKSGVSSGSFLASDWMGKCTFIYTKMLILKEALV